MFNTTSQYAILDWALALLVGALLVTPTLAGEEAKELATGEEAILAALEKKTTIECIDEPLSSVVDHFRMLHNIEIQVDISALDDVNIGTDTPITKSLQNLKFRSALNLILRDLDLTWMITDEVLVITTPEEAELHSIARVYDVGDLVTVQDPDGNRWQDFDALIDALTSTIVPCSWEDVGGPGSIAPLEYRGAVVLIISQTHDVHSQVAKLLEDLTKIADMHGDDKIPTRERKEAQPAEPGFGGMGGMGGMDGMNGMKGGGYM